MNATVCLPTYNERANLEPMLRALGDVLRPGDRVLVIDDSSPDGTGEIADRLASELDFVDVLHRAHKEGLGPAYLAGFRRALATRRRADPRDGLRLLARSRRTFPRLIAAAEEGADLVLGSRYVPGGRVGNWGLAPPRDLARRLALHRPLPSDGRARPDRRLQVLSPATCWRRSTSTRSRSRGYAFQIETTYRVKQAGFRVVEIPITFNDRTAGHSKMSKAIVLEAVWAVPLLRLRG